MLLSNKISKLIIDNYTFFPKSPNSDIPRNYKKVVSNERYELYQSSRLSSNIVAAFKSVVVCMKKDSNSFTIFPNYCNRFLKFKITFNKKNFPDLIEDSKISDILIIPYLKKTINDTKYNRWRVIVITDKCQIYHNFPARNDEDNLPENVFDIKKFEESVIWDIPGRKYPSMNKECIDVEKYFPHLPSSSYEYHPKICRESKYGNHGFNNFTYITYNGKKTKVSRFYIPIRKFDSNPFTFMGGFEADYKMTLIGTYESNKNIGVRTCLFATSDGGRTWYAKMEFDDSGDYDFKQGNDSYGNNFGNPLINFNYNNDNTLISDASIQKRTLRYGETNSEDWESPIGIKKIYWDNTIVIETEQPHNLVTGNIVKINGNDNVKYEPWKSIFFDNSSNNFEIFKVKKINNNIIELYEFVSNCNSKVPCRHIHHINRVRDGWIMGTGEIYPNGWLFYIQMREADTYMDVDASDDIKILKLNNEKNSIQRTVGADIIEKDDSNFIIFASDHDKLNRKVNNIFGLNRGTTGIYYGKLENINDFNKFKILYETKEPAFFFKKIENHYIFCGQRGELLIFDINKSTYIYKQIDKPMIHYKGSTFTFNVIDNYILKIK